MVRVLYRPLGIGKLLLVLSLSPPTSPASSVAIGRPPIKDLIIFEFKTYDYIVELGLAGFHLDGMIVPIFYTYDLKLCGGLLRRLQ